MRHRPPVRTAAALLLALTAPPSGAGQMWLQFSTALGGGQAQRVYVYLDGDRVPGGRDRSAPTPGTSPASPAVVGFPLMHRGRYVPNLVYEARNRATAGYDGDLGRLCRLRPLSCALSTYALAGSPLLDLGLYRADDHRSASHRLAP